MASCLGRHAVMLLVLLLQGVDCAFNEVPWNTTCILGQDFEIHCRPPSYAATARWRFGGQPLYITNPPAGVTSSSRGNLFKLSITCEPRRHYITVQCIAVIDIGGVEEESPPIWVRVQGIPDRVENINSSSNCSSIELAWDPSPGAESYCVSIYNITKCERLGNNNNRESCLLREECSVNDTQFVLTANSTTADINSTDLFEFVVTAVSRLGYGPPSSVVTANFTIDDSCLLSTTERVVTILPTDGEVTFAERATTLTEEETTPIKGNGSELVFSTPPESGLSYPVIISIAVAIIFLFLIGTIVAIGIVMFVAHVVRARNGLKVDKGMSMTVCKAYEDPAELGKKYASYESIPGCKNIEEHIYEHI